MDYIFFNWLVIILGEGRDRLKVDIQGQGGGRILDVYGQGRPGILKIG